MQMSQPIQMASDRDIMSTRTHACMHKHTHEETSKHTHTVEAFFLKANTTCVTYQTDKVETGEGLEMGAEFTAAKILKWGNDIDTNRMRQ